METTIKQMIVDHLASVERFNQTAAPTLAAAAELLVAALRDGRTIYTCGNGGSAADAQHIAAEIAGRFLCERPGLPAVALTTDTSLLTAVANDYGFERIFARQVEAYLQPGDVLWALSTSGNSPNVVAAVKQARQQGGRVLGFSGRDGGELADLCDICLTVPERESYSVQHLHQLAYHICCAMIDDRAEWILDGRRS